MSMFREYRIYYSQPRINRAISDSIIWERKEEKITATDDNHALKKAHKFMQQGSVLKGIMTFERKFDRLVEVPVYRMVSMNSTRSHVTVG